MSARALKLLCGFSAVFTAALLALTFTAVSKAADLSRLDRLERSNEILAGELSKMTTMVGMLTDTLGAITEQDRTIRLLAGMEPSNPDVLQAGIGGPQGPRSEDDLLLLESELGQRALAARVDLETLNRRALMLASSFRQAADTLSQFTDRLSHTPSIMPVDGFVSSGFSTSRLHPLFKENRPHEGTDVVAPAGASIVATAAGRVVDVGNKSGYGLVVTLDHGDGIQTRYAHCSRILVQVGDSVERGGKIAEVGRTGWATNNHVHYEVLVHGRQVNPATWIFGERIVD
ncbi:MAG: M23 family metallopeptidase [Gemmatimonadetes bacterium]|nr:M23 family metallopeptidase [Gemmatimonadota bacterium]